MPTGPTVVGIVRNVGLAAISVLAIAVEEAWIAGRDETRAS